MKRYERIKEKSIEKAEVTSEYFGVYGRSSDLYYELEVYNYDGYRRNCGCDWCMTRRPINIKNDSSWNDYKIYAKRHLSDVPSQNGDLYWKVISTFFDKSNHPID